MKINNLLQTYGLNSKEVVVYLSLIKKVEASAYILSKETKIPPATMYEILDDLKEKGLVSVSRTNGKKRYTAESPNRLLKILKEKEEAVLQAIPTLLALGNNKGVSPTVKLYMGKSGVATVLDDIVEVLDTAEDKVLYAIAGSKLHYEHHDMLKKWVRAREQKGIVCKLIDYIESAEKMPELYPTNRMRETRYVSEKFFFDSTVDIYGDKVAIFSGEGQDEHAIIIESPSISKTFKRFHEFIWKHAVI